MQCREKLLWFGEVFEHIRANHQIELAQFAKVLRIDIEWLEWMMFQPIDQEILLIRKSNSTTLFQQLLAKNSMAATEINCLHGRTKDNSLPLQPAEGVVRLHPIKLRIISVLEVMRYELGKDHWCDRMRGGYLCAPSFPEEII